MDAATHLAAVAIGSVERDIAEARSARALASDAALRDVQRHRRGDGPRARCRAPVRGGVPHRRRPRMARLASIRRVDEGGVSSPWRALDGRGYVSGVAWTWVDRAHEPGPAGQQQYGAGPPSSATTSPMMFQLLLMDIASPRYGSCAIFPMKVGEEPREFSRYMPSSRGLSPRKRLESLRRSPMISRLRSIRRGQSLPFVGARSACARSSSVRRTFPSNGTMTLAG